MDRTNAGLQVKLSENAMEISGPDCPLKCNRTNGWITFPEATVFGKIQVLHGLDCPPGSLDKPSDNRSRYSNG
jgi:hypothetical protein